MSTFRILVAEDNKEARDIIVDALEDYFAANPSGYKIDKASSFQAALQKLNESGLKRDYYDIFFSDIDFTEDNKGGKRDSGYELITKAFEVCPATNIVTYSGQFHARDLWDNYETLKDKGLVMMSMDKSHSDGGDVHWLQNKIAEIIKSVTANRVMLDMWQNNTAVLARLNNMKLDHDPFVDLEKKNAIRTNLESAFTLQKNLDRIDEKSIFYRLMIYLYHASLEILLKGEKQDQEIEAMAKANRDEYQLLLRNAGYLKDRDLTFNNRCSALHVIVAQCRKDLFRFAYLLNMYRNNSIHENKKFRLDQLNVLFAHLTLTACLLDPKEIASEEIERFTANLSGIDEYSKRDFSALMKYLKS